MKKKLSIFVLFALLIPSFAFTQNIFNSGSITGNFQMDAQYYQKDSNIGAPEVPEQLLMNSFANIIYTNGKFTTGLRYESYRNPMLGFDNRYKGSGIAYRFATYTADEFDITIGNFYEQFGSGLIFRSYEERNLGYDNAMDGVRVKFNPVQGVMLKAIIGTQRFFWEEGPGIVRGGDAEFALNDLFSTMAENKTRITLGVSAISKFQATEEILYDATKKFDLPENVAALAGRMNLSRGNFNLNTEYAYKSMDPNSLNNYIYRHGEALMVTASYSQKGLGVILSAKRIDNMAFKSKRTETGNMLFINYLPALTKQHTYNLSAMYPYASQPNGEMAIQGEIIYTIPKNTFLGGKYGTELKINYSRATSIDKKALNDSTAIDEKATKGYTSGFFMFGDKLYFQDFNLEVTKKINTRIKGSISYVNILYNKSVIEGHPGAPEVTANIVIADITYKLTSQKSIRFEGQHLLSKGDLNDNEDPSKGEKKNWIMGMIEYSISPHWFFSVMDQYNYSNDENDKKIHFYNVGLAYNKNSSRIQLSYGKQREGILCVGGVCRQVPAANGLSITITSSF